MHSHTMEMVSIDYWEIPGLILFPECSVNVYNRSGQIVFHSIGYNKPWDGKLNGKVLPVATYYWIIKQAPHYPELGGSITLLR